MSRPEAVALSRGRQGWTWPKTWAAVRMSGGWNADKAAMQAAWNEGRRQAGLLPVAVTD